MESKRLWVKANIKPRGNPAKNATAANFQFQSLELKLLAPLGKWAIPNTSEESKIAIAGLLYCA